MSICAPSRMVPATGLNEPILPAVIAGGRIVPLPDGFTLDPCVIPPAIPTVETQSEQREDSVPSEGSFSWQLPLPTITNGGPNAILERLDVNLSFQHGIAPILSGRTRPLRIQISMSDDGGPFNVIWTADLTFVFFHPVPGYASWNYSQYAPISLSPGSTRVYVVDLELGAVSGAPVGVYPLISSLAASAAF